MKHNFSLDARNVASMFWTIFRQTKPTSIAEDYLFHLRFNQLSRLVIMRAAHDLKDNNADLETTLKRLVPLIETAYTEGYFIPESNN